MLSNANVLKPLYCTDNINKPISAAFSSIGLTLTNEIAEESPVIKESICSGKDLRFGACNASQMEMLISGINNDLSGLECNMTQAIGGYTVPLGIFTVKECLKQDDLVHKKLLAYDRMKKIEADVAVWYNGLFPVGNETYTLAAFRSSFLAYVGLTEDISKLPLPNDSMTVPKTISPSQISGRDVIEAIEEINGAFGKITRDGKFGHKILPPAYGLYPGTFYPGQEYPRSETDTSYIAPGTIAETVTSGMIESIRFEEYTVKEIDKLIIRQEENDVGAIVGTGTNAYIIEGNFLVFGKSAAELAVIAQNAFANIARRPYRPYESVNIGLPYLEVGDMVKFNQADPVTGYIFQRTLKGIQALQDEVSAEGNQERQQNFGTNKKFIQIDGKMTKIQTDVDGVKVSVSDLDIQLTTEINVVAGEVELKVDKAGVIAAINLSSEEAKISAAKINLAGYVTITSLSTPGSVEIDGGNLKAGTVFADEVSAEWAYLGSVTAGQITSGGTITGVSLVQTGSKGTVSILDGGINANWAGIDVIAALTVAASSITVGNNKITLNGDTGVIGTTDVNATNGLFNKITVSQIGGGLSYGTPIHSGNIGSQSVQNATWATSAGNSNLASTASNAYNLQSQYSGSYIRISSNDNMIPSNSGMYVGTSGNPFAGGYGVNDWIQTSDERRKTDFKEPDERFLRFGKMLIPYLFKMVDGTSGRDHFGYKAQQVKQAMDECNITDMEFAGWIADPIYSKKLLNEDGSETDIYDTTSEIIDYNYGLRYDEVQMLYGIMIKDLYSLIDNLTTRISGN